MMEALARTAPPPKSGAPPGAPPPVHPFKDALTEEWARTANAEGQKKGSSSGDLERRTAGHPHHVSEHTETGAQVQPAAAAVSEAPRPDSGAQASSAPSSAPSTPATDGRAATGQSGEAPASEAVARDTSSAAPTAGSAPQAGATAGTSETDGQPNPAPAAESASEDPAAPAPEQAGPPSGAKAPPAAPNGSDVTTGSGGPASGTTGEADRVRQSSPSPGDGTRASSPPPPAAQAKAEAASETTGGTQPHSAAGDVKAPSGSAAQAAALATSATVREGSSSRPSSRSSASAPISPGAPSAVAAPGTEAAPPSIATGAAPVVPGQAAPAATPGAPLPPGGVQMQDMIEAIHASIELAARQGVSSARISLEPAELGEIRIHLSQTGDGLLARVTADTPAAAQALAAGRSELHQALSSLGTSLLGLDIGSFSSSEGREERQAGDAPGPSRGAGTTGGEESIDAAGEVGESHVASPHALGELVDVLA